MRRATSTPADRQDNTGNRRADFNAPTSPAVTNAPVFALEDFEEDQPGEDSNARFTPPLVDAPTAGDPQAEIPAFQRVRGVVVSTGSEPSQTSTVMYAPDFNPADRRGLRRAGRGQSDFSTPSPADLTQTSCLSSITSASPGEFDGGVMDSSRGTRPSTRRRTLPR